MRTPSNTFWMPALARSSTIVRRASTTTWPRSSSPKACSAALCNSSVTARTSARRCSPSTRTAYSRSTPKRGCISLLASSPELVNSSRPSVLRSSRPTDCHLPCCSLGSLRNTVGRFCGSSLVTTSPTGLWYAMTRAGGGAMRTRIGLPLTLIWSPNWMRWPMWAGSLLTEIRPSVISCSISRREPRPAWASTLCSLGVSGWGDSTRLAPAGSAASSSSEAPAPRSGRLQRSSR